jgi:hypothetical protein
MNAQRQGSHAASSIIDAFGWPFGNRVRWNVRTEWFAFCFLNCKICTK